MNDSFLYVQPVYVRADQTTAVPELKRVVVANGDAVGVGDTLLDALAQSVEGQVDTGGGGADGGGTPGNEQTIAQLLDEALGHFQAAQDALTAGDLATYQSELDQAQDLIEQANELARQDDPGRGEPPPSPSAASAATPRPSAMTRSVSTSAARRRPMSRPGVRRDPADWSRARRVEELNADYTSPAT